MVPPWAVGSPIRAAGLLPISTVDEPLKMVSGGPVQVRISPAQAAGIFPISTWEFPGGDTGPPTCGIGGVPGVCIGQECISPTLAAAGIFFGIWELVSGIRYLIFDMLYSFSCYLMLLIDHNRGASYDGLPLS